jgi:hypothetical protein
MMRAFFGGRKHGKGTATIGGVVEGRCEESAGVCEESAVGDSGGEEVEAHTWCCSPESHEAESQLSIS